MLADIDMLSSSSPPALNKLEKVSLRHAQRTGKPLILILNNVHYFNHDDDGRNMLLQFQQRAEGWAASGGSLEASFICIPYGPLTGDIRHLDHGLQHVRGCSGQVTLNPLTDT